MFENIQKHLKPVYPNNDDLTHMENGKKGYINSIQFYLAQSGNELKSSFHKFNCLHDPRDEVTRLGNCLDDQIRNHPKPVLFKT